MTDVPTLREPVFRTEAPRPDAKVFHGKREFALELSADAAPEWHAFASKAECEEVWIEMPIPDGIYDPPAPTSRVEIVGDEKRAICNVEQMPDVVYVNGVRFIPAGGR